MTLTNVLLVELVFKGTIGALLLLLPTTTARIFGLPHGPQALWPRVAGLLLIGVAAAIWVENDVKDVRGLGLGGLIAINIVGLVGLVALTLSQIGTKRRGQAALWLVTLTIFVLTLSEIVHL